MTNIIAREGDCVVIINQIKNLSKVKVFPFSGGMCCVDTVGTKSHERLQSRQAHVQKVYQIGAKVRISERKWCSETWRVGPFHTGGHVSRPPELLVPLGRTWFIHPTDRDPMETVTYDLPFYACFTYKKKRITLDHSQRNGVAYILLILFRVPSSSCCVNPPSK